MTEAEVTEDLPNAETSDAKEDATPVPASIALNAGLATVEQIVDQMPVLSSKPEAEAAAKLLAEKIAPLAELTKVAKKSANAERTKLISIEKGLDAAKGRIHERLLDWKNGEQTRQDTAAATRARAARESDEELRLARADALEAVGRDTEAAAVLDAEPRMLGAGVPEPVDLPGGLNTRTTWHAEVTDLAALARAAANPKRKDVSIDLISANMPTLNKLARALKENLQIPGVEAKSNTGITK